MSEIILCKNCEYWAGKSKENKDSCYGKNVGNCSRTRYLSGQSSTYLLDGDFGVTDKDGYYANLITDANFGCIAGKEIEQMAHCATCSRNEKLENLTSCCGDVLSKNYPCNEGSFHCNSCMGYDGFCLECDVVRWRLFCDKHMSGPLAIELIYQFEKCNKGIIKIYGYDINTGDGWWDMTKKISLLHFV